MNRLQAKNSQDNFQECGNKRVTLGSSIKVKVKVTQSCLALCGPMDYLYTVHGIIQARILEWVAFPFSKGIFPTQCSNPGLPHFRQIIYQLSHKGSPRRLEWVAYPFSRGSFWPRNQTRVSCIAGRFFTIWAIRLEPIKPEFSWYIPGEHLLLGST